MFSKILNKLIFLILIIFLSKYNILAGLACLFVYIYFSENNIIENFDRNKQIRPQTIHNRTTQQTQTQNLSSSNTSNINPTNKSIKNTKDDDNTEEDQANVVKPSSKNYDEAAIHNKIAKQHEDLTKSTDNDNENLFRNKYCTESGILVKNNVPVNDVNLSFPNLKFSNEECNPCSDSCKFDIISTREQLTTIENIKSIDSNTISVDRKKAIKKNN